MKSQQVTPQMGSPERIRYTFAYTYREGRGSSGEKRENAVKGNASVAEGKLQ
jgi:hypothetical protein